MSVTSGKTELANLIPQIWSSQMYAELRNSIMFANVFSRQYEGEIRNVGDVVKVNQIVAPTGEILTNDKDQFNAEAMTINQFTIEVNKRASAAYEITDLAALQSLDFQAEAQAALVYAIRKQMELDIISALIPSASAPDHQISPAAAGDLAPVDLSTMRTLLSTALVPNENRFLMLSPSYFGDLLNKTATTSVDFVSGRNGESGQIAQYMGFQIAEHNLLGTDVGYAVHPSAMQIVMQQEVRVKISDMHASRKFGFLLSADMVYGIKLYDNRRIVRISG